MLDRLRHLFSPAYREGVAAEAAGDLEAAARAFARGGHAIDLFRVRLALAERAESAEARCQALFQAIEAGAAAGLPPARLQPHRRRLAHLLLQGDPTAEAYHQAIDLLVAAGDVEEAADHLLAMGALDQARRLLEGARRFEHLEAIDRAEAERLRAETRARTTLEEALERIATGARGAALERLHALAASETTPDDLRSQAREAASRLETRRLGRTVRLQSDDGRLAFLLTGPPLVLGRSNTCALPFLDPGVSRRHARLVTEAGHLVIEDLESRNGTLVDNVRIAGRLVLHGPVRLRLGETLRIRLSVGPPPILEVERGLLAGARCVLLRPGDAVGLAPLFPGAGAEGTFEHGPEGFVALGEHLDLTTPGIDGRRTTTRVELHDGDRLTWPGLCLEVTSP